ncbi:hypothetical protein ANRL4_01556 [Anaerolineae bacterium]|nr:hypothetical protein ANRL4_01556 [Anaerolineae bacterium]
MSRLRFLCVPWQTAQHAILSSSQWILKMEAIASAQRDDLKSLLAGGSYRTLIDVILDEVGRLLQKLTRQPRPVSFVYSAATLCLLILLVDVVVSILSGEYRFIGERIVLIEILGILLAFASLVIFKVSVRLVFSKLRDDILDAIASEANLIDLRRWLGLLCNLRLHLTFSLIYALTIGTYIAKALSVDPPGGLLVTTWLVAFIWALPMYLLLIFLILPGRLSQYDYRLYKGDPSSSEVVAHLSSLLTRLVYLYAVVAAGSMVYLAYAGLLAQISVISIIVAWLPITFLFVSSQLALGRIITRAKWQTLNEVQEQIQRIEAQADLGEKETMDKMNRLMDYHDRVKATRNSTFDLRAILTFVNSLLLPILGFLLGHLGLLQGILPWITK